MPLLRKIKLRNCPRLRALPCLGSLESLEKLTLQNLPSVKYVGNEFYGFDVDSSLGVEMIAFSKLKTLKIKYFDKLKEWEIPISKDRKIMPVLTNLVLRDCPMLRALPPVWRMESLEELSLGNLHSVERVGAEFVDDNEGSLQDGLTFPKLKIFKIRGMSQLEEWSVPLIAPCLVELKLIEFQKLRTLPTFKVCVKTLESLEIRGMFGWQGKEEIVINDKEGGGDSCGLRRLEIGSCPNLRVVPDYMFSPSLKVLVLDGDVGVLFDSFPAYATLFSITSVVLSWLPQSRLPKGFHQLKALQSVHFWDCKTLDFDLKELAHFTVLRYLRIIACPLLKERFKGDDWRTILAHVPTIDIDDVEITNRMLS